MACRETAPKLCLPLETSLRSSRKASALIDRFNSDIDEWRREDQIKTGIIRNFVKIFLIGTD